MTVKSLNHQYFQELIPWYVNGTLDEVDMVKLDRHLEDCPQCQKDVEREINFARHYVETITETPTTNQNPELHLNKLLLSLDRPIPVISWRALVFNWKINVAVACSVVILAVSFLYLEQFFPKDDARYQTLTTNHEVTQGVVYQVIFGEDESARDISKLLDAAGISLLNGPSSQGVYRLEIPPQSDPEEVSEFLKSHAHILIMEKEIQ